MTAAPSLWQQAKDLRHLAVEAIRSGDFATAAAYVEQWLALYTSIGDKSHLEEPLGALFNLAFRQQEWLTARDYLYWIMSLTTSDDLDSWLFLHLAIVERHLGHHEFARHHFALAYDLCVREERNAYQRDALWEWGQFEYHHGDHAAGINLCTLAILMGHNLCNPTPEGTGRMIPTAGTTFREDQWQIVVAYEAQFAQMHRTV